jgi:hypothetical protein
VSANGFATDAASSATNAAASAAAAQLAAKQATAGGLVTSVAGKVGDVVIATSDIADYVDPVALSLVFGS